jgi:hypothetical protein
MHITIQMSILVTKMLYINMEKYSHIVMLFKQTDIFFIRTYDKLWITLYRDIWVSELCVITTRGKAYTSEVV